MRKTQVEEYSSAVWLYLILAVQEQEIGKCLCWWKEKEVKWGSGWQTDLEDKVFAEEGTEVFQTQRMVFLPCSSELGCGEWLSPTPVTVNDRV